MTLATAADYAAQVVDARVVRTKSRWREGPRRIETVVTLAEVEYLKRGGAGTPAPATFDLIVPGGAIGPIQMRIAGAPEFHPGQRWILFLLPTYKTHPVVGITTGAFRVDESGNAGPTVRDASGRAVIAVNRSGAVEVVSEPRQAPVEHLVGGAGTRLRPEPRRAVRAMTRDEFVTALQPILSASRRHVLTHPAGRPAIPVLTPTALKPSLRQQRDRPARASKPVHRKDQDAIPEAVRTPARRREP